MYVFIRRYTASCPCILQSSLDFYVVLWVWVSIVTFFLVFYSWDGGPVLLFLHSSPGSYPWTPAQDLASPPQHLAFPLTRGLPGARLSAYQPGFLRSTALASPALPIPSAGTTFSAVPTPVQWKLLCSKGKSSGLGVSSGCSTAGLLWGMNRRTI